MFCTRALFFCGRTGVSLALTAGLLLASWASTTRAQQSDPQSTATDARRVIQEAIKAGPPVGGKSTGVLPPPAANEPEGLVVAKLSAEVAARQLEAKRRAQKSPAEAMAMLDELAASVEGQPLPDEARAQLLRRIERTRVDIEETTGKRRGELALEQRNAQIEGEIDRERAQKGEVEQRIALLVEEYNDLIDEKRFAEAEAVAKKAGQLAPDLPVVRQLIFQSKTLRQHDMRNALAAAQQEGLLGALDEVEQSAIPFAGDYALPDAKTWEGLTQKRRASGAEGRSRATAAELAIQRRLTDAKVKPDIINQPLAAALDTLSKQAGVSIHLDMVGLDQEAVRSDTPVTLDLD